MKKKNNPVTHCSVTTKVAKLPSITISRYNAIAIPIALSLCLTACAPYMDRVPLEITQRKSIKESNEILFAAPEIKKEKANNSYAPAAAAGGIVGIMASAAVVGIMSNLDTNRADQKLMPLRSSLANYHFSENMNQSLTEQLNQLKWLRLDHKEVKSGLTDKQKNELTKSIKKNGDVLITVDFSYKLSAVSLDTMIVTAEAGVYKKEMSKAVIVYKNTFEYCDQLNKSERSSNNLNTWSINHAARARKSLDSGISLLS